MVINNANDRFERSLRSVSVGLVCNIGLAVIKTVAGIIGHSYALIADGIESLMDVFSSLIVLGGIKISSRPADANHPYGHGRAESLAAMIVAVVLLLVGVRIAFESLSGLAHPRQAPEPFTLFVLLGVIFVKEFLFRSQLAVGVQVGSTAVKTDAWHHRSDALTSLAALIGISVALIGGSAYAGADNWAALLASVVIGFNGIKLLKAAVADLMDQAQAPHIEEDVRRLAAGVKEVVLIEKCRIRKSGFDLFVDIHVQVDPAMSVANAHEIAHQVKDVLVASSLGIADVLVHIEPAGHQKH